jgi:hypothetical protein
MTYNEKLAEARKRMTARRDSARGHDRGGSITHRGYRHGARAFADGPRCEGGSTGYHRRPLQ